MSARAALAGLDLKELAGVLLPLGEPSYRAGQVVNWLYRRGARSFDEMTDLPAQLRAKLPELVRLFCTEVAREHTDSDGTVKLALRLKDGHTIESVMISEGHRRTGCVSTQVGCPVGCAFCASGAKGLERNLEAAEVVEQVLHLAHALPADEHLTHVVFMGIGEGLLNFRNLVKAVRVLNAPWGMQIGARRMTVSTVGIPGTIEKLAELGLQINLAISLHAATDELRKQLIPHGRLMRVQQLIDAAEDYYLATGREVTFEYVLLAGVNDSAEMAARLAEKIKPCHAAVNLIPYNEVEGAAFRRPSAEGLKQFRDIVRRAGVRVTSRRRRGTGIRGACGQLRLDALGQDTYA